MTVQDTDTDVTKLILNLKILILSLLQYLSKFWFLGKEKLNFLNSDKASIHDIKIIFHSKNYVLINKRYDVAINSNDPEDKVTVQTQLKRILPALANPRLGHEFYFMHRLDYATSGILCIPTHKEACRYGAVALMNHKATKYYLAIVRGHLAWDAFEVDVGIGKNIRADMKGIKMGLEGSANVTHIRSATTRVLVLERGISHDFPATKVLLMPLSGRRHQLRLHLNFLGHTIVGDYMYSKKRDIEPYRMFLHAFRLAFDTPNECIDVTSGDPFSHSNPRNRWTPVQMVNELGPEAMSKLKKGDIPCIKVQGDITCIKNQGDNKCIKAQEDNTCIKGPGDITCIRAQGDNTCIKCPGDITCIKAEGDNTCIKDQGDITCIKAKGDNTCIKCPGNTCIKAQGDNTCIKCPGDITYIKDQGDNTCIKAQGDNTCIKAEGDNTCIKGPGDITCIKAQGDITCSKVQSKDESSR